MSNEEIDVSTESLDQKPINPSEINDWASAFDALEKASAPANTEDGVTTRTESDAVNNTEQVNKEDGSPEENISVGTPDKSGESLVSTETGGIDEGSDRLTKEEIDIEIKSIRDQSQEQAVKEVADAFIKQGIRNTNGRLGATLQDADIYKKDEDGILRFYNPDTNQPFTGDNPRSQAKQWVDEYNSELKDKFNEIASSRVDELMQLQKPTIEMLQFDTTYNNLDDVRREMLDAIIEDYEVYDNSGEHIGYSCDLNKALSQVNKQISRIQSASGGLTATPEQPTPQPTKSGPAVDMKAGGTQTGTEGATPKFENLAQAIEYEQDKLLSKQKGKK